MFKLTEEQVFRILDIKYTRWAFYSLLWSMLIAMLVAFCYSSYLLFFTPSKVEARRIEGVKNERSILLSHLHYAQDDLGICYSYYSYDHIRSVSKVDCDEKVLNRIKQELTHQ